MVPSPTDALTFATKWPKQAEAANADAAKTSVQPRTCFCVLSPLFCLCGCRESCNFQSCSPQLMRAGRRRRQSRQTRACTTQQHSHVTSPTYLTGEKLQCFILTLSVCAQRSLGLLECVLISSVWIISSKQMAEKLTWSPSNMRDIKTGLFLGNRLSKSKLRFQCETAAHFLLFFFLFLADCCSCCWRQCYYWCGLFTMRGEAFYIIRKIALVTDLFGKYYCCWVALKKVEQLTCSQVAAHTDGRPGAAATLWNQRSEHILA